MNFEIPHVHEFILFCKKKQFCCAMEIDAAVRVPVDSFQPGFTKHDKVARRTHAHDRFTTWWYL